MPVAIHHHPTPRKKESSQSIRILSIALFLLILQWPCEYIVRVPPRVLERARVCEGPWSETSLPSWKFCQLFLLKGKGALFNMWKRTWARALKKCRGFMGSWGTRSDTSGVLVNRPMRFISGETSGQAEKEQGVRGFRQETKMKTF